MTEALLEGLQKNFWTFLLVFQRISILLVVFPLFSATFFPIRIKLAFSLVFSLGLTPIISFKINSPQSFIEFLPYLFSDFLLIFVFSLFFRLILAGLELGGEVVGLQMGFGISQTFDPLSGVSMPLISQFLYFIFLLFFWTFDIHHHILYFIVKSFESIPPGTFLLKESLGQFLAKKGSIIFDISVKVLAPLIIFMLFINLVLAIIGRLIPQINILFVSFPLTLGLGLLFFGLMLIVLPKVFGSYLRNFSNFLEHLLKI